MFCSATGMLALACISLIAFNYIISFFRLQLYYGLYKIYKFDLMLYFFV